MTKRIVYTDEFKQDAVRLVIEEGLSKAETSRRLGVGENALRRWVQEYQKDGQEYDQEEFLDRKKLTSEQKELRRLREENRQLKMEREILKKATAFFAKETK